MAVAAVHASSMMEQLPVDLLARVLEHLNIVDRIKLASTNLTLQHRVYREASKEWEFIKFHELKETTCQRLTDGDLSALLLRIDAVHVTRILSLYGCSQITGGGLRELRGSRMLELVNLCFTQAEKNDTEASWILRSMIPFNLIHVTASGDCDEPFLDLNRNLRYDRLRRRLLEQTTCAACNLPITEKARVMIGTQYGVPLMQCSLCDTAFCRRASCPTSVRECELCGFTSCDNCVFINQCFVCGHTYCRRCREQYSCFECANVSCEDCEGGIAFCCVGKCKNQLCRSCGVFPDICSNDCFFCKGCRENVKCAGCTEKFCFGCEEKCGQCSLCNKVYCGKSESCADPIAKCDACNEASCKECKELDHCDKCGKDFCVNHNRLVDCKSCKTLHCRLSCAVDICKLCNAACHEGCKCREDLSSVPPAKKVKLS